MKFISAGGVSIHIPLSYHASRGRACMSYIATSLHPSSIQPCRQAGSQPANQPVHPCMHTFLHMWFSRDKLHAHSHMLGILAYGTHTGLTTLYACAYAPTPAVTLTHANTCILFIRMCICLFI